MTHITFVTAWYNLKSKFNVNKYKMWMQNFLGNVNSFFLVIFTNKDSFEFIEPFIKNPKIKIIFKEFDDFHCMKYDWIKNHQKNDLLNDKSRFSTEWKLNMLWNEKIAFVAQVINEAHFDTNWYGWCDIGYFREKNINLKMWPNPDKIKKLNIEKIYYAKVSNNINYLVKLALDQNEQGLPKQEFPPSQISFAGGFFLIHANKCSWWHETYYNHLEKYFHYNYLVKDDQIIILDCIINNLQNFQIIQESDPFKDKWFAFQTYLL